MSTNKARQAGLEINPTVSKGPPTNSTADTLYQKLVATNPEVQLKGAGVPNTIVNGHMFSYLTKNGKLALRLPEGVREEFLKTYKANLCVAYGRVQAEYVEVPDAILVKTSELEKYFAASFDHVSSLKPKKT